jgi:hypothetical protein
LTVVFEALYTIFFKAPRKFLALNLQGKSSHRWKSMI